MLSLIDSTLEACLNVFMSQSGIVLDYLGFSPIIGHQLDDKFHCYARTLDHRFSSKDSGILGYSILPVHDRIVRCGPLRYLFFGSNACQLLLRNILNPAVHKSKRSLMEKLHLPILVEIDEDGLYKVSCPLLEGCHSWGETVDEAMKNISEVIEMCLEETKIEDLNTFVDFREL